MVHRQMESLPIQPSEYRGRRLTVAGAGWRVNPPRAQAQRCGPRRPDRQPAGERTVPRAPHTPSGHRAGRPRVEHSHNVLRRRAGLTSPRNVLKSVRSPRSILPVRPSTPSFRPPISPKQQREPSASAGPPLSKARPDGVPHYLHIPDICYDVISIPNLPASRHSHVPFVWSPSPPLIVRCETRSLPAQLSEYQRPPTVAGAGPSSGGSDPRPDSDIAQPRTQIATRDQPDAGIDPGDLLTVRRVGPDAGTTTTFTGVARICVTRRPISP